MLCIALSICISMYSMAGVIINLEALKPCCILMSFYLPALFNVCLPGRANPVISLSYIVGDSSQIHLVCPIGMGHSVKCLLGVHTQHISALLLLGLLSTRP